MQFGWHHATVSHPAGNAYYVCLITKYFIELLLFLLFSHCSSSSVLPYSIKKVAPLTSFDVGASFVLAGQWLPGRPCVTMCVTDAGQLVAFDLKVNQCMPAMKLDITERRKALLCIAGNLRR